LVGKVNLCTIVFHLQVVADENQRNMSMEMGNQSNMSSVSTLDTCSKQLARTDAVSCSSGVVYTQSTCREDLLSLQGCLPDRMDSRNVYISATNQEAVETQANNLLSYLDLLDPSPGCRALVQPFLCLYLFGLCDSHGTAYQPTFEQCILISTDVCATEWLRANRFLTAFGMPSLPECTSFPSTTSATSGKLIALVLSPHPHPHTIMYGGISFLSHAGSGSSGEGETTSQPPPSARLAGQVNCSTLQCQEGFSCIVLWEILHSASLCVEAGKRSLMVWCWLSVVIILSAAVGFIASIVVFIITCI